ncbi:MAG: HAD hydrolase family protein [Eggerthellaceae bacterium]|jgi:peptidyl-prolyl cis-trans isomerase B (cyclophilin B)
MRKRYLFFDYDGTLRSRSTDSVPKSAQDAIAALNDAGHFVALATGRLQRNALELAKPYGITSLVADGGNSLTVDGKLVWIEGMPLGPCRAFLHWLDSEHLPWAVMVSNELIRYTRRPDFTEYLPDTYMKTVVVPNLSVDELDPIYKIFVPCAPGEERRFPFNGVTWARYSPLSIYCEPTDKSVGIRKMVEFFNADERDVVVFGDGSNDLSMFQPEWTSVAMGNAIGELKARADLVTSDIDEDGIWRACKQLQLF